MIPPLFIALVVLAGLLLWFIIGSRGKWWVKLPLIVIVPAFMFLVWASLSSFTGWPSTNTPPNLSQYIYGYTIEPNKVEHIKGGVYVWLIPQKNQKGIFDYKPTQGEPRAYVLSYTPKLEQQISAANKAVTHGKTVAFGKSSAKGIPGKKKTGGHGGGASGHQSGGTYHPYVLPPVPPALKGSR